MTALMAIIDNQKEIKRFVITQYVSPESVGESSLFEI